MRKKNIKRQMRSIGKKGFLDISFSMIFTILIGGMIIFGAVYAVKQFSTTSEIIRSATSGKDLGNIITGFETSSDESKMDSVLFPTETKIINRCSSAGKFGTNSFEISEEIKNKMSENTFEISFNDKYIFSQRELIGKKFNLFAKQYNAPFKVATVVYLMESDKKYCFDSAPRNIERELKNLNQNNFEFDDCESSENKDSLKVCFERSSSCDIEIDINYDGSGSLEKYDDMLYFDSDTLMYAAIFSDAKNYECGVRRLMMRVSHLSNLYMEKSIVIRDRCESEIIQDIDRLKGFSSNYNSIEDIQDMTQIKELLDRRNSVEECRLW